MTRTPGLYAFERRSSDSADWRTVLENMKKEPIVRLYSYVRERLRPGESIRMTGPQGDLLVSWKRPSIRGRASR